MTGMPALQITVTLFQDVFSLQPIAMTATLAPGIPAQTVFAVMQSFPVAMTRVQV